MNVVCRFCKDLRSESESASLCCRTEKVKLPSENPFPDIISNHLNSEDSRAKYFRAHMKEFTQMLAFTSIGILCIEDDVRVGM